MQESLRSRAAASNTINILTLHAGLIIVQNNRVVYR